MGLATAQSAFWDRWQHRQTLATHQKESILTTCCCGPLRGTNTTQDRLQVQVRGNGGATETFDTIRRQEERFESVYLARGNRGNHFRVNYLLETRGLFDAQVQMLWYVGKGQFFLRFLTQNLLCFFRLQAHPYGLLYTSNV